MADSKELIDLRSDFWGKIFNSADERVRNTEKLVDYLTHLAFPKFEDEPWAIVKVYKPFTFVHDTNGDSYVSLCDVPSGIPLSNIKYWTKWDVRDGYIQSLESEIKRIDKIYASEIERVEEDYTSEIKYVSTKQDFEFTKLDSEKADTKDLASLEAKLNTVTSNMASQFTFKGSCAYSELPSSGNTINDTYYVTDKGFRYSWNGTGWCQSSNYEDLIDTIAIVDGYLCFKF